MKPNFEKMARAAALKLPLMDHASYEAVQHTAALLREAYAAGYRDGQERMRERASHSAVMTVLGANQLHDYVMREFNIEEPPT